MCHGSLLSCKEHNVQVALPNPSNCCCEGCRVYLDVHAQADKAFKGAYTKSLLNQDPDCHWHNVS